MLREWIGRLQGGHQEHNDEARVLYSDFKKSLTVLCAGSLSNHLGGTFDDLNWAIIHAMHGSMQKIQILFPDPLMEMLRNLARIEDRPVSEIVRRAVDRDLEQRAGMLKRPQVKSAPPPTFPTFAGGKILAKASEMKALIHGDESP